MVSKKAGSKLDEEYRQKASELVNFYNDNNTVITRRPPLQKWDLEKVGHRFEDLEDILDYVKLDSGEELLLQKGITSEELIEIIIGDEGIFFSSAAPTTRTAVSDEIVNNIVITRTKSISNSGSFPKSASFLTSSVSLNEARRIRRSSSNISDLVFKVDITAESRTIMNATDNVGVLVRTATPRTLKIHATFIEDALGVTATKTYSADIKDTLEASATFPDKFSISDDKIRLLVNNTEYTYDKNLDAFTHPVFTSFIDDPSNTRIVDVNELGGSIVEHKIIEPAIRIAALHSNVGSQSTAMTNDKYTDPEDGLIGDWSLAEIEAFTQDHIDAPINLSSFVDGKTVFDAANPAFETPSTPRMKRTMQVVLSRIVTDLKDRFMPVTTVIPVEGGYKIAPDIKIGTKHNKTKSICEELYTDEEIQVWSYPERNDRSFFDDTPTQVGRLVKGTAGLTLGDVDADDDKTNKVPLNIMPVNSSNAPVEVIDYRVDESLGAIQEDSTTKEEFFRDVTKEEAQKLNEESMAYPTNVDKERGIGVTGSVSPDPMASNFPTVNDIEFIQDEVKYRLMPKTWLQRIPDNGGSLYALAYKLVNLFAEVRAENADTNKETDETRRLEDRLADKDPISAKGKASWQFSTAPNTDEDFPAGSGHGRYSGVGACFVALPYNREWTPEDYNENRKLGVHKLIQGIPPFITKIRSLADTILKVNTVTKTERKRQFNIGPFPITATRRKTTRKSYNYDIVTSEGFETTELGFSPKKFKKRISNSNIFSTKKEVNTTSFQLPDDLKQLNIIDINQTIHLLHAAYIKNPRAIKFRVYYDYGHPELKDWYEDKKLVNVSIPTEFGINSPVNKGLESLTLIRESCSDKNKCGKDIKGIGEIYYPTYRPDNGEYTDPLKPAQPGNNPIRGSIASNNLFPKADLSQTPPSTANLGLWRDQFLLRLFDLPVFTNIQSSLSLSSDVPPNTPDAIAYNPTSASYTDADDIGGLSSVDDRRGLLGSFWCGPQPMMLPGPTYRKLGGDASGFFPLEELDPPHNDAYFLGNLKDIESSIRYNIEFDLSSTNSGQGAITINRAERGHEAPMACYSNNVMNFDLSAIQIDTVQENRDIFHGEKDIYISRHSLYGGKNKSDSLVQYWAGNHNLPGNDLIKVIRDIPNLGPNNSYPEYAAQPLSLDEKINSVVEHEDNIFISTDNQVLQIPAQTLGPNSYPITRRVLSRGIDTNIVHESTNYFGAQDNQIISFKYYEQAQGYLGFNETKDYTPEVVTQMETFIQKHNIAVAISGGTKSIHILALGGDRRTNGFSRFDFPFVVSHVRKLDHDRMLIFFEGERPRTLNFNYRNEGTRYADYISETEFKIYKSTAANASCRKSRSRQF